MAPNVLVVRLSSLGDVILTAPVCRSLKAQWPGCRVSVLVKPAFAGALEGNPWVDEVIPFQGLGAAARLVAQRRFTHLLDLHANLRSRLLRRMVGVPQVSVYRKHALARRLFVALGLRSPALEKHTVERYLDALIPWGLRPWPDRQGPPPSWVSLEETGAAPAGARPAANVLLLQSAFLGDSLLTVPLARHVKELMPRARLAVLTLPGTADVFRRSEWVDEVMLDDKRGEHSGLGGLLALSRQLRARRFDLALIPHRSLRSALLAYLGRIPRRIGFDSSAGRAFLTETVPFTWLMHDLERNLALLKPLAPRLKPAADESLYLRPDPESSRAMERRLAQAGVDERPLVGVHPGSTWPTKRWPAERFAELCRRLERSGRRVVLVGGPRDADVCVRIAEDSGALDWSGRTDLLELTALMPRLSLFITNDSGPMHLAAACGVPTLAFFGPTTRELGFFPYGAGHRVLEADLPCRPCGLHGARSCPRGHFLCMGLITPDEAWAHAQSMLAPAASA